MIGRTTLQAADKPIAEGVCLPAMEPNVSTSSQAATRKTCHRMDPISAPSSHGVIMQVIYNLKCCTGLATYSSRMLRIASAATSWGTFMGGDPLKGHPSLGSGPCPHPHAWLPELTRHSRTQPLVIPGHDLHFLTLVVTQELSAMSSCTFT